MANNEEQPPLTLETLEKAAQDLKERLGPPIPDLRYGDRCCMCGAPGTKFFEVPYSKYDPAERHKRGTGTYIIGLCDKHSPAAEAQLSTLYKTPDWAVGRRKTRNFR